MNTKEYFDYSRLSMNELRTALYEAGIEYPDDANREDLILLYKKMLVD